MLLHSAGLAWLHFVFAFLLVGALAAELFMLRLTINAETARRILRADLFFGLASVGVILAGAARVLWGEKGWAFYEAEPFFWAKMGTFVVIGLLSIVPTRTFMRWAKAAKVDAAFVAPAAEVNSIRRWVLIEVHLIALLLLFASLMARGLGQS